MALSITAESRSIRGRATDQLRANGKVPGIVYGFEIEPVNIELDRNELERLYENAGESSLVDLKVGNEIYSVLIQDLQRDPLTDFLTHVDFRKLNMNEKVETTIPITLIGEAPAVKELGGTLIQSLDEVDVEALPAVLVREFTISVESLKTFEDSIRVSDLTIPEGMDISNDPDQSIASVIPPRSQEEIDALDSEVDTDVSKVEVATEKDEEVEGEKEEVAKKE
ncbi:MAG: 50S ribosomal protein L25 [Patescibacteria group bacterium]|nr:50S ribosomal protein L25 [Patescibacteria group bacterium]